MTPPLYHPRPERWPQVSLRGLLLLTALIGTVFGWIVSERQQSERERHIAQNLDGCHAGIKFGGPYDLLGPHERNQPQDWWRTLARHVLGQRIISITVSSQESRKLQSLTPLTGLTNLRQLRLYATNVRDFKPLAEFKSLEGLSLGSNSVTDLTPLAGLKKLSWLALRSNPVTDLAPISGLTNLRVLELAYTPVIEVAPLAGLTNLKRLDMQVAGVSDLRPLAGLSKLEWLFVGSDKISRQEVDAFQKVVPNCHIRWVNY